MTTEAAPPVAPRELTDCRHLRTKRECLAVFRHWASPRVIAAGVVLTTALRLVVGGWSWWDLLAVGIVVAVTPFAEWVIHLHVLHAEPRRVGRFELDNGIGHRQHHLEPSEIQFILLRGIDAFVFQIFNGVLVAAITFPVVWALGGPLVGPLLTAVLASQVKLLEYEWDHFFFHTAYRPKTRWYKRLKQNHRLHHWRNEHHWLGVTVNFGDRVLGTYPKSKTAVPLSSTARTLGRDPEEAVEPVEV